MPNLILSSPHELRLRLRWVAILYGHIKADLAITGGVHTAEDVVKTMMAGARVAMMTSALLKHGIELPGYPLHRTAGVDGEHEYDSIRQMQGSMSRKSVPSRRPSSARTT